MHSLAILLSNDIKDNESGIFYDEAAYPVPNWKPKGGWRVNQALVWALVRQESTFLPKANSKAGAKGLMQLMPSTAKGLGVTDPMNPVQNVEGGVKYLKSMLDKYNGNIILALAAYNAGPNAVDKYTGVPPYQETQEYVKNILSDYL